MNTPDLLYFIRSRQAEIESTWGGLPLAEMVRRPGVTRDWSAKDLIAHLTYWENRVLADIQTGIEGKTPTMETDVDATNYRTWSVNRNRPLAEVLAGFRRSHERMLAYLDTVPEPLLTNTTRFPWAEGGTLLTHILSEYQTHYDAHLPDLRRWRAGLASQAAAREKQVGDAFERYW